jgi:hypothetical protein
MIHSIRGIDHQTGSVECSVEVRRRSAIRNAGRFQPERHIVLRSSWVKLEMSRVVAVGCWVRRFRADARSFREGRRILLGMRETEPQVGLVTHGSVEIQETSVWRPVRRTVCGTFVLLVIVAARGVTPQDSQRPTPNKVKWPMTGSSDWQPRIWLALRLSRSRLSERNAGIWTPPRRHIGALKEHRIFRKGCIA